VIREAIKKRGMVALGRVVLSTREHVIALEPRDRGIVGLLLHYPYEVREPQSYFDDIPKEKTPKEMLDLASHIIETMIGHFQPKKSKAETPEKKMNLMDALRASLQGANRSSSSSARKRLAGKTRRAPPGARLARTKGRKAS
jgi:DNA end-binding protein Ku